MINSPRLSGWWCLLMVVGSALLIPVEVLAQTTPGTASEAGGVLDQVIAQIKDSFATIGNRLADIARAALFSLLVVDFVLRAGRAIVGNEPIEGLLRGFAFQIGFVALAAAFIMIVPEFVDFLAEQAIRIAGTAGSPDVSASNLVGDGLRRAANWIGQISVWSPGSIFYVVAAAISVIVLAVTVAMLVVIWAELYLCALAGLVALMFAGLTETRDIAVGYVNSLVGKAFKLMGLLIIVAATGEMTTGLTQVNGGGFGAAMAMILMQIVGAILIMTLPDSLESLVGGRFSSGASNQVGRVAQTAATGAMIGVAAGGAAGVAQAGKRGAEVARAGGSPGAVLGATVKGLGEGARDGGIAGSRSVARAETLAAIGNQIAQKLGHKK